MDVKGMWQRLDRGTRIYALVLLAGALLWVGWALYEDPQVAALNRRLDADPVVSAFPYRFRVLRLERGVATMSTPRSSAVPVARVLGILFPEVAGRAETSAAYLDAQQRLARVQTRARDLVLEAPGVERVAWALDRTWLERHGVVLAPAY